MQLNRHTEDVSAVQIERLNEPPAIAYLVSNRVGESPIWSTLDDSLYWIDVRAQELLQLFPERRHLVRWKLPDVVGAATISTSGHIWLAMRHGLARLSVQTGQWEGVCEVPGEPAHNRLNDGKTSPSGRWFVFGSMDDRPTKTATGSLYCSDARGHVKKLWSELVVCNGIAFSLDATQIYFSDSAKGLLHVAAWDETHGHMGPPRLLCALDEQAGRPDGATVDRQGLYVSAGVSAGCLNKVDAQGTLVYKQALPCRAPTMPTFGGSKADTLYVTTLVREGWGTTNTFDGALLAFPGQVDGRLGTCLSD